jgi:hypothetical protein
MAWACAVPLLTALPLTFMLQEAGHYSGKGSSAR